MGEDQKDPKKIGRLHVLTDYHFQQRFSHSELAENAIAGGADTIQFRQKYGSIIHKLREAKCTGAVCLKTDTQLIINDDVVLTLAVNASGVHLGREDLPIEIARTVLGPRIIVGATATTMEQALSAEQSGADYIGFGPVFETKSKSNPASVKGIEELGRVCKALRVPVIAIAGITPNRVGSVMDVGAHGVAVMTAITNADNPEKATAEFYEKLSKYGF